jgi:subtilisin family serine protease
MGKFLGNIRWIACLLSAALGSSQLGCSGGDDPPEAQVDEAVLAATADGSQATFWIVFGERADLSAAQSIKDWDARGRFVVDQLKAVATRSQNGVISALQARGAAYRAHWIVNTLQVTGERDIVDELARRPEVESIVLDGAFNIPPVIVSGEGAADVAGWNIAKINADLVWPTYGDGEGIVVGSIDTGVAFDHEALVGQYRGNLGDGTFSHDYNFWDYSEICGRHGSAPCDNEGHGTHTMGTIAGGESPSGDIGVAPGAKWITAKGCEGLSCSFGALVSSGEWMLAPTDLHGNDPRPSLRPHVINNSWGGGPGDPFFQDIVSAWRAAGIAPVFSIGNAGPGCGSAGSPGDYPEAFGTGATDMLDEIAYFSSRGASAFGQIKPDASAPGVGVLSSVPGGYAFLSGTSMAAPHVTGTLALLWSADPNLIGDIDGSFDLIRSTALDRPNLDCGGDRDGDPNNTYGEGRIDALAAVTASPRVAGALLGTVTDAATGTPITNATVTATRRDDGLTLTRSTDAMGAYSMPLPVDPAPGPEEFDLTATIFGYEPATATVEVIQGETIVRAFTLTLLPSFSLSGVVRDDGGRPLAGATVEILEAPIPPATTDADGFYTFPAVPVGTYDAHATRDGCHDEQTQTVAISGDARADFTLATRTDRLGYRCDIVPIEWVEATDVLRLSGDNVAVAVALPFSFPFYDQLYDTAYVSTNGFLNFLAPNTSYMNEPIPSQTAFLPNAAIYAYWDDLYVDAASTIGTKVIGAAPDRAFVIQWQHVALFIDPLSRIDFEVKLHERTGEIDVSYLRTSGEANGASATIGIENELGDDALQYAFERPVISDGLSIHFVPPPRSTLRGLVLDANDGQGVPGATVRALRAGEVVAETTAGEGGDYGLVLELGTYTIEATATNYTTEVATVTLDEDDAIVTHDFVLRTARAEVAPEELELIVLPDNTRTKILTLSSTGSEELVWSLSERAALPAAADAGAPVVERLFMASADVLMPSNVGGAMMPARPSAYAFRPAAPASAARILIYADDIYHRDPFSNTLLDQALQRLGLAYTAHYDGDFGGFEADLASGGWDLVLVANDYYGPPSSMLDALDRHVASGGKLGFHGWTVGFTAHPLWERLGFVLRANDTDPPDPVYWWDPTHQIFTDPNIVPEFTELQGFRYGTYGQHVEPLPGFEALAGYTTPGPEPDEAALVLGNERRTVFKGFLDGQNDQDRNGNGVLDGVELWMNLSAGLLTGFVTDVPWLSVSPTSGTLAPESAQEIAVTVDTASLAPGVYRAALVLDSNSARAPVVRIPVTLIVPAYLQAVNAGGDAYVDAEGEPWGADQPYSAGSYGFTAYRDRTHRTRSDIAGTDDDLLYQTYRSDPVEYRFDGLPAGVYELDTRFAEPQRRTRAGTHQFDVIVEGSLYLPAHDIAGEVGPLTADEHVFFLRITDGQLNVRFAPRGSGEPIVSALRVTHRPDL